MADRSKLVKMIIKNLGCIGPEGLEIEMDNFLCLVGPNNTGKSTVLRAYELALGTVNIAKNDICQRAGDLPASVEMWVHIPLGTPNIAEDWKIKHGDLLIVKSKWEWDKDLKPKRTTWNPSINDYSEDAKASGLDNVFTSRLPRPFRIGALEDPEEEHKRLLTIVLQPIADKLKAQIKDVNSDLFKAIRELRTSAQRPVEEEREDIGKISDEINKSHVQIFPNLSVGLNIGLSEIDFDPLVYLQKGSKLKFKDWSDEIDWTQQGTGSQRALFWAILQVRSRLKTLTELKEKKAKDIKDLQKKIKELEGKVDSYKKEETKKEKLLEIQKLREQLETVCMSDYIENAVSDDALSLPGYMLLIDEPEIALHPNAIRAASRYLYSLSNDPAWQVMITTHSPSFIDPLQDHTTIVRLNRTQDNPSPKTYRSDSVTFSEVEKENLKLLNRFDPGLAEMFFGQYPILIEGDTEFAAFDVIMNTELLKYPIGQRPILIRARGKDTLILVLKMLEHFKVSFSILHDSDFPYRRDGAANSAWSANKRIYDAIVKARTAGIRIIHRISIPYFELAHSPTQIDATGTLIETSASDKPWKMFDNIRNNTNVKDSVVTSLDELISSSSPEEPFPTGFEKGLQEAFITWATTNAKKDPRCFKVS